MSGRYEDYKGSSRSTRDDSRQYKGTRREYKESYEKRRSRSRSRSPRRRSSPPRSSKYSPPSRYNKDSEERQQRDIDDRKDYSKEPNDWDSSEEDVPAPPPPPRITKISIGFTKPKAPIKMSIGGPAKPTNPKPSVASVFSAEDDDDEPEEMPAEAKMRMRNIGRETPTSAGPNSFGKTKQGFCDAKKVFEKNLKQALETVEKPTSTKFPQTIYKIKGP